MTKTLSFIKGLGEHRALAAGNVERLEALLARIADELAKAKADLASYDRVIRLADTRLDPTKIPAVRGWQLSKKYKGKRDTLEEAVLQILQEGPTVPRSTIELATELATRMRLNFPDATAFSEWLHNSVSRRLKKMAVAGMLVRLHEPNPSSRLGWWRLPGGYSDSLEDLQQQAERDGVQVQIEDVAPEEQDETTAEAAD